MPTRSAVSGLQHRTNASVCSRFQVSQRCSDPSYVAPNSGGMHMSPCSLPLHGCTTRLLPSGVRMIFSAWRYLALSMLAVIGSGATPAAVASMAFWSRLGKAFGMPLSTLVWLNLRTRCGCLL